MIESFTGTQTIQTPSEALGYGLEEPFICTDEDGIVLGCNPATKKVLGYAAAEIVGTAISSLFAEGSPHPISLADATAGRSLLDNMPRRHPCRVRCHNGDTLPADVIATIVSYPQRREQILVIIPREKVRRTVAAAPEMPVASTGLYVMQSGRFCFANDRFQRLLGFSQEELSGVNPAARIHPNDRERVRQEAMAMLKNRRTVGYEFRFVNRDGEIRLACESVTLITYASRPAVLGSFIDITEPE